MQFEYSLLFYRVRVHVYIRALAYSFTSDANGPEVTAIPKRFNIRFVRRISITVLGTNTVSSAIGSPDMSVFLSNNILNRRNNVAAIRRTWRRFENRKNINSTSISRRNESIIFRTRHGGKTITNAYRRYPNRCDAFPGAGVARPAWQETDGQPRFGERPTDSRPPRGVHNHNARIYAEAHCCATNRRTRWRRENGV